MIRTEGLPWAIEVAEPAHRLCSGAGGGDRRSTGAAIGASERVFGAPDAPVPGEAGALPGTSYGPIHVGGAARAAQSGGATLTRWHRRILLVP
jgi:hypothetical protein